MNVSGQQPFERHPGHCAKIIRKGAIQCLALLAALFLSFTLCAEQLTVSSLIELKALGFSEAEIQEQVVLSGEAIAFDEAGLQELRNAGFSEDMIRFLKQPPPAARPPAQEPGGTGQEQLPPARTPTEPATSPEPQHQPPPLQPEPATPAFPRALVLDVQHYLNLLGYDAGGEDGIMGHQTEQAIRLFQRDAGIPADGIPSTSLLAELIAQVKRQATPSQGLVGGWYSTFYDDNGTMYEMYLDLFPDGTFSTSSQSATGAYAEAYGNYTVRGQELTMQNQTGAVQSYRFRMSGQELIVQLPGVSREVVLSRYSSELQ